MRYLVRGRVKPGKERALLTAIERGTLGAGSVAEGEYLRNMRDARLFADGTARWVEICYCDVPLAEERPYWEEFFDLVKVQDAHARANCRDENGSAPWACDDCDCTERLAARLAKQAPSFLPILARQVHRGDTETTEKSSRAVEQVATALRFYCSCPVLLSVLRASGVNSYSGDAKL